MNTAAYCELERVGHTCVSWEGMPIVETCRQTKRLEMQVTLLPNLKNEQLLLVVMDFQPCKKFGDWRKLVLEWSDLV